MSREFSFKDFFFYGVNRWFYALLAMIVGVVAAIGFGAYQQTRERETLTYQAAIVICDIETYAAAFGSVQDSGAVAEGYRDNSKRAMDVVYAASNHNAFLKVEAYRSLVLVLMPKAEESDLGVLSGFLEKNLKISGTSYRATVEISYLPQDTKWSSDDVSTLLNSYIEFLVTRIYENVDSFRDMKVKYDAGQLARRPIRSVDAELAFSVMQEGEFWKGVLFGAAIGGTVALLVLLALYLIDPRMKSVDELVSAGFPVLVNTQEAELNAVELAAVSVNLDKMTGICVFEPGGDFGALAFGKAFARYLLLTGYKVLFIDGISQGGRFRNYIEGESTAIQPQDGVDTLVYTQADDFAYLLAKKERFKELERTYDKIVFCCDAKRAGAVAAGSSFTGAAICVLDKMRAKTKDIFVAASELSETVLAARGVVYTKQNGK